MEIPDTTPAEVVAACELLLPFAKQLTERRPDVFEGEAIHFLELLLSLSSGDLH